MDNRCGVAARARCRRWREPGNVCLVLSVADEDLVVALRLSDVAPKCFLPSRPRVGGGDVRVQYGVAGRPEAGGIEVVVDKPAKHRPDVSRPALTGLIEE